jgi:hypothetical protein
MEYEPNFALFQRFEPLFGSYDLDPDLHRVEKSDTGTDPHTDPYKKISIRTRAIRVSNTSSW